MYGHVSKAKTILVSLRQHMLAVNVLSLAAMILLAALYIGQVNTAVSKSYTVRDLEQRLHVMKEDGQKLELVVSRMQTLDHVEQSMKILGFIPSGHALYLTAVAPVFAWAH